MSTRLHLSVCDQKGLAYHVGAALDPLYDTSLVEIDSACAPDKLPQLASEVMALLSDLRTRWFRRKSWPRPKRRYAHDVEAGFDDLEGLCSWFGGTRCSSAPAQPGRTLPPRGGRQRKNRSARWPSVLQPERMAAVLVGSVERSLSRRVERILRILSIVDEQERCLVVTVALRLRSTKRCSERYVR